MRKLSGSTQRPPSASGTRNLKSLCRPEVPSKLPQSASRTQGFARLSKPWPGALAAIGLLHASTACLLRDRRSASGRRRPGPVPIGRDLDRDRDRGRWPRGLRGALALRVRPGPCGVPCSPRAKEITRSARRGLRAWLMGHLAPVGSLVDWPTPRAPRPSDWSPRRARHRGPALAADRPRQAATSYTLLAWDHMISTIKPRKALGRSRMRHNVGVGRTIVFPTNSPAAMVNATMNIWRNSCCPSATCPRDSSASP